MLSLASYKSGLFLMGLVTAAVAASNSGIHAAIIVGLIVGVINTIFLVYLNNRQAKHNETIAMLAQKDREIDRLSRRCDKLVEVLERSGITVRDSDKTDVRDG